MSFGSSGRYGGFGSDSPGYSGGGGSGSYGGGGSGSGSGDYGGGGSSRGEYPSFPRMNAVSYPPGYDSYGDGGSGGFSGGFRDTSSRRQFQEYDAGDDDVIPRRSNSVSASASSSAAAAPQRSSTLPTSAVPEPKAKQPEIDLLGMDDDAFGSAPSIPTDKALPALGAQSLSLGTCHIWCLRCA